MKLNLSLVKNDQCEKILGYKTKKLPISSQICATGEKFKSDSCSGDSGGPLMAFNNISGQTEVIGIVSIGIRMLKFNRLALMKKVTSLEGDKKYLLWQPSKAGCPSD